MTLKQILDLASAGYGSDGIMARMYDKEGKETPDADKQGDTLALFIVRELSDTFDCGATSKEQVIEARRVMNRAGDDLNDVYMALDSGEQS